METQAIAEAATDEGDRRVRALQRLQRSRDQMVDRWVGRKPVRAPTAGTASPAGPLSGLWRHWADTPVGLVAGQALQAWWKDSPWRVAGEALHDTWRTDLQPWVRRHPVLSAGLTLMTVGAVLRLQPWALPGARRQAGRAWRYAHRGLRRQLAREPWRSLWMAGLASLLAPRARPDTEAPSNPSPHPLPEGEGHG